MAAHSHKIVVQQTGHIGTHETFASSARGHKSSGPKRSTQRHFLQCHAHIISVPSLYWQPYCSPQMLYIVSCQTCQSCVILQANPNSKRLVPSWQPVGDQGRSDLQDASDSRVLIAGRVPETSSQEPRSTASTSPSHGNRRNWRWGLLPRICLSYSPADTHSVAWAFSGVFVVPECPRRGC